MARQIGSQLRERINETDYTLYGRPGPRHVVLEDSSGKRELWAANDDHAGYTIEIGRWGYEFVRDVSNVPYIRR